jgi:hypothetical protein
LDWLQVGFSNDPTPGLADTISRAAGDYDCVHSRIVETKDKLRRIDLGEMKGEAVEKFRQGAGDLADALARVEDRYSAAAYALDQFSRELETEQSLNDPLLEEALAAQQALTSALDAVRQGLIQPESDSQTDAYERQTARRTAEAQVANAKSALAEARGKIRASEDRVSQAASDAAGRLTSTMEADGLTQNWFEWAVSWTWENIDSISSWLNIAALVLCWVPGLNVVLRVAATIADVVATVKHVMDAMTSGDWGDVIWDAVGFLTLGAGKIAAKGFKGAHAALTSSKANTLKVRAHHADKAAKIQADIKKSKYAAEGGNERQKADLADQLVASTTRTKGSSVPLPTWRTVSEGWHDDLLGLKALPKKLPQLKDLRDRLPFKKGGSGFTKPTLFELSSDAARKVRVNFELWRAAQAATQGLDAWQTVDHAVQVVKDVRDFATPDRT